jgi:hypothetical protein
MYTIIIASLDMQTLLTADIAARYAPYAHERTEEADGQVAI